MNCRTDTGPMSTTMCALSSVARLSVSMTMLMSSGAHRKRLYVDGLIGSASGASQASCSKRPAIATDDEPTPPPAQLSKPQHHRHLWKMHPKCAAAAATGRGLAHRGKRVPARIESLPNMWNETMATSPQSAASARRKVYGNGGRSRSQATSFSGRGHHSHTGASVSVSNDAMTTEESSTSCDEDSSDGPVFDIIREESIKRPSGRAAIQQDSDTATTAAAIHPTTGSSPINNSGVSIVIHDNNEIISTDVATLPTESSKPLFNTNSSLGKQQQQQGDERTSVCQQSGSKTFLLSEMT